MAPAKPPATPDTEAGNDTSTPLRRSLNFGYGCIVPEKGLNKRKSYVHSANGVMFGKTDDLQGQIQKRNGASEADSSDVIPEALTKEPAAGSSAGAVTNKPTEAKKPAKVGNRVGVAGPKAVKTSATASINAGKKQRRREETPYEFTDYDSEDDVNEDDDGDNDKDEDEDEDGRSNKTEGEENEAGYIAGTDCDGYVGDDGGAGDDSNDGDNSYQPPNESVADDFRKSFAPAKVKRTHRRGTEALHHKEKVASNGADHDSDSFGPISDQDQLEETPARSEPKRRKVAPPGPARQLPCVPCIKKLLTVPGHVCNSQSVIKAKVCCHCRNINARKGACETLPSESTAWEPIHAVMKAAEDLSNGFTSGDEEYKRLALVARDALQSPPESHMVHSTSRLQAGAVGGLVMPQSEAARLTALEERSERLEERSKRVEDTLTSIQNLLVQLTK
ncbi:hypothetical protein G7046_g5337 [Stylonectria norvegica]|nr:hypothetical protein G7046_g5337 [Stylonectria norvegica]